MKNTIHFLSAILVSTLFFSSCTEENVNTNKNAKGTLSLVIQQTGLNGSRIAESATLDAVYLSVKDSEGNYVLNLEKLTLINFGGEYLTENVAFEVGDYTVEDFIVVDEKDTAIYVTPKEGSDFSSLVNHPLPVDFTIGVDSVSNVRMEVIPIADHTPDEFGYANFGWDVVDLTTLDSGLLVYYPFNKNTYDFSPNGIHAFDSTESEYIIGAKGHALNFNGESDFLTLSDTLSTANGLTFSFWVNSAGPTENENLGVILSKYSYGDRNMSISTFGYGENKDRSRISAHFYTSPSSMESDWVESDLTNDYLISKGENPSFYDLVNPQPLVLNEWVHCVINTSEDSVKIYLDGELTVEKVREHDTYNDSSDEPIYIGNMFNGADGDNNHLNGALDEFRIYNRELTDLEIQTLYLKY